MLDSIEPCSKFRLEQTALKRLGEESRIRKNPDQICNRLYYVLSSIQFKYKF